MPIRGTQTLHAMAWFSFPCVCKPGQLTCVSLSCWLALLLAVWPFCGWHVKNFWKMIWTMPQLASNLVIVCLFYISLLDAGNGQSCCFITACTAWMSLARVLLVCLPESISNRYTFLPKQQSMFSKTQCLKQIFKTEFETDLHWISYALLVYNHHALKNDHRQNKYYCT